MNSKDIEPWLFQVEPFAGESLSHFLGRFRRANHLTPTGLGQRAGIGAVVARWEKFYLNSLPTPEEWQALASVVGVEVDRLLEMLPPKGVTLKPKPIMLCGVCYGEAPYHRIQWQFKENLGCVSEAPAKQARHPLRLLSKCTNCGTPFPIPALWQQGECLRCCLPFATMAKRQKSL